MNVAGISKCVQCPVGCDDCDLSFACTACLSSYTMVSAQCVRTSSLDDTCDQLVNPPDTLLPLPGLISAGLWCLLAAGLKMVLLKGSFLPYSLLYGTALVQFVVHIISLSAASTKLALLDSLPTTTRLLTTDFINNSAYIVDSMESTKSRLLSTESTYTG